MLYWCGECCWLTMSYAFDGCLFCLVVVCDFKPEVDGWKEERRKGKERNGSPDDLNHMMILEWWRLRRRCGVVNTRRKHGEERLDRNRFGVPHHHGVVDLLQHFGH